MTKQIQTFLLCVVFIGSTEAMAQDSRQVDQALSLFEGIEVPENRAGGTGQAVRESRVSAAEPEFTLLGTSRIGGSYSAILRHRGGDSILVRSQVNTATAIADHAGYSVLSVGAGKLTLRYPAGVPCVEDVEQGVRCAASPNTAELVLATGAPLSRPVTLEPQLAEQGDSAEPPISDPANPFEALRAARANGDNPAQINGATNNRFTPRRISPEAVPEGMRVVSTPFGDRLVEE